MTSRAKRKGNRNGDVEWAEEKGYTGRVKTVRKTREWMKLRRGIATMTSW